MDADIEAGPKLGRMPTKHLGIRLDEGVGAKLDKLVADEQKKAGPHATVSASSFVVGLITTEFEKRFPPKTAKKKP